MMKFVLAVVLALTAAAARAQFSSVSETIWIDRETVDWKGNYYIGHPHGANTLVITNGGKLIIMNGDGYLGCNSDDSRNAASVAAPGSVWAIDGRLRVGVGSPDNQLTVRRGAMVHNTEGMIGYDSGCNAALVTGAGSVWSNRVSLAVGSSGAGNQLVIADGGTVHSAVSTVGDNLASSNNMVLVSGAGSVWYSGSSVVGNHSAGNRLTISDGGTVQCADSRIGNMRDASNNTVVVSGTGSVWRMTTLLVANNASTGNGLILSNGGVASVNGSVTIAAGGYVTNYVAGVPGGLDVAGGHLALEGKMAIVFTSVPRSTNSFWGLRLAGIQVAALREWMKSGALTIDDSALPAAWRNRAGIYWDGTHTGVGFHTFTNIVVTPEQFGAQGDGVHDDTDAFSAAAGRISTHGSGTLVLSRGRTYRVGRQVHVPGQYPYYQTAPMFAVRNDGKLEGLRVTIEGHGATVKLNDGLRYGSFDKDSGTVYTPTNQPFLDGNYAAQAGNMFAFDGCASVEIRDLTIDGNISRLIKGGLYGDTGIQLGASGLTLMHCDRIRIDKVTSSHCGLDGISLGYSRL
ncbi:MAG: hypothetical protein ACOYMV_09285, partial [Verrucomicrobiia bacterium]